MTSPLTPRIDPVPKIPSNSALAGLPPLNIFRTLARAEPIAAAFHALGGHLLQSGSLPPREREIVILRTGWRSASEYEFGQHTRLGQQAGLTEQEIARLADADADAGSWSNDDALLVALVDELCDDNVVSDATWTGARARWSEAHMLELLVLVGFYRLVSGLLTSVGVALEPGTPGWPAGAHPQLRAPRDNDGTR